MPPSTHAVSLFAHLTRLNSRQTRHRRNQSRVSVSGFLIACYHTAETGIRPRVDTAAPSPRRPPVLSQPSAMPKGTRASSAGASPPKKASPPPEPRPSASILLLSPTNQVLLLRRVKTSTSFASAHVFPGGNLSDFHDGAVPPPDDANRHVDSPAYRTGAIRETFEESGILLARKGGRDGPLLNLPTAERDRARKAIYENEVGFSRWVESVGGVVDTDNLLPFTRWITPLGPPKRFTTQMYVYMLPLETDADPVVSAAAHEALIPTPDGGAEVTTAHFDDAAAWLAAHRRGDVMLFPPQYFLLHLLAGFLTGAPGAGAEARAHYGAQRERLRLFLDAVPTCSHPAALRHPSSRIPWAEKVISPVSLGVRADGRTILALDKPGRELGGGGRGGDWERVVLVRFRKEGPADVEVRGREEVLAEERARGAASKL